jgi:hypothetical protein
VRDILLEEVEVYDQYLSGDVYGFVLKELQTCPTCNDVNEEVIDSCWGFYGGDFKANGMFDAIPHIEHFLKQIEV